MSTRAETDLENNFWKEPHCATRKIGESKIPKLLIIIEISDGLIRYAIEKYFE